MRTGYSFVVRTNLPPETVTSIGVEIFLLWLDFALGGGALNGKKLIYPSGRYAAAISFRQVDAATVAIVADEDAAPEAAILETGHRGFDMKTVTRLQGRAIPMHRPVASPEVSRATGLRRTGSGPPGLKPAIWAELRSASSSGFASFGPHSAPDSWMIPPMQPYAPAMALAVMAKRMARERGG